MARLATDFIGLDSSDIDAGLERALCELSAFFGTQRAGIGIYQPGHESWTLEHEWHEPGLQPLRPMLVDVPVTFLAVFERLRRGEPVAFASNDELQRIASGEAQFLSELGVESIFGLPILAPHPRGLLGFIVFTTTAETKTWDREMRPAAEVVAGLMLHALDRKASDRALATAEKRMQALERSQSLGVFVADTNHRILRANPKTTALLPSILHQRWQDVLQPRGEETLESIETRLKKDGHVRAFEADLRTEQRNVACMVSMTRTPGVDDGEILGLLVDLSERKRAEAELSFRYGRDRLLGRLAARLVRTHTAGAEQVIVDVLREAVEFLEVDRCSMWLTDAEKATMAYHWTRPEFDDSDIDAAPIVRRELDPPAFDLVVAQSEILVLHFDGPAGNDGALGELLPPQRPQTAMMIPMMVRGQNIGFLALLTIGRRIEWDVARLEKLSVLGELLGSAYERDRTRLAVAEMNSNLERLVDERTAQLSKANKELESFSYSVSHDLRSPLRTIDGFSEILLQEHADNLDEQGRELLARVRKSSQRMGALIDALLELARVTRSDGVRESINLTALAKEQASELAFGENLDFEVYEDLETKGEPRLIALMMRHLLRNALRATTDNGQIVVGEEDGRFFVHHSGPVLDRSRLDGMFQTSLSYTAFDSEDSEAINMITVRRIVDLHGGQVSAQSPRSGGTTVYFSLGASDSQTANGKGHV